jgi:translation initiation factor 1A
MSKKNSGGKNFKKQKKSNNPRERELVFRENEQSYARIIKNLGDGRFECECFEPECNLIGIIRGSMRKRVWLGVGDTILVSFRDFDNSKCDIIHKYTSDESMRLKSFGEIPHHINLQATALDLAIGPDSENNIGFEFDEI